MELISNMVHTKGKPDMHPVEEERIFVNITYYGIGEVRLTQPRRTTFLLSPSGLDDLFIDPVSVSVEIAGATILQPSAFFRVRRDSLRFPDSTKESLRGAAPAMVDWAVQVVTDRRYYDPPYRLTVQ